jgi:hypothetical protein
MYGLTRATLTLIGAGVAGFLLWLGARLVSGVDVSVGEHWLAVAVLAAAGLTMALSQLLGGWTKWGWPRVSGNVFLIALLPVLIVGGWVLAFAEPGDGWLGDHVRAWSDDIGVGGVVDDLTVMIPAIAFGIGLVFGLTFDTTGPRTARTKGVPAAGAQEPTATGGRVADDRRVELGDGDAPRPESAPRTGEPAKK